MGVGPRIECDGPGFLGVIKTVHLGEPLSDGHLNPEVALEVRVQRLDHVLLAAWVFSVGLENQHQPGLWEIGPKVYGLLELPLVIHFHRLPLPLHEFGYLLVVLLHYWSLLALLEEVGL